MALIDQSSKKIVPFDSATYRPMRRNTALFKPPRPRRGADPYSRAMATDQPFQIEPYSFPGGSLGGLGDLAGATGIPAIDNVIDTTQAQIAQARRALQVTAAASVVAAVCGLILVSRR